MQKKKARRKKYGRHRNSNKRTLKIVLGVSIFLFVTLLSGLLLGWKYK